MDADKTVAHFNKLREKGKTKLYVSLFNYKSEANPEANVFKKEAGNLGDFNPYSYLGDDFSGGIDDDI